MEMISLYCLWTNSTIPMILGCCCHRSFKLVLFLDKWPLHLLWARIGPGLAGNQVQTGPWPLQRDPGYITQCRFYRCEVWQTHTLECYLLVQARVLFQRGCWLTKHRHTQIIHVQTKSLPTCVKFTSRTSSLFIRAPDRPETNENPNNTSHLSFR